jgi:hypothetical protein
MMMVATKRARVDRGMVTEMRMVGDKEGKGNDEKDGVGDEGGVRRRGRWRRLQERWQQGWRLSNGDEGDGNSDGDGEGDDVGDGDGDEAGSRWGILTEEARLGWSAGGDAVSSFGATIVTMKKIEGKWDLGLRWPKL